jgi:hypothetical protein
MDESSECCNASRHHIFCDLCGDCQEWAEFICEPCNGKGWIESNSEDGNTEIQKCDECSIFKTDLDALNSLSFLNSVWKKLERVNQ